MELKLGTKLGIGEIKKFVYIKGMDTWSGKDIADTFNELMDVKIDYLGDSEWEVVRTETMSSEARDFI